MVLFYAMLGLCLAFFAFIASFMQIISKGAYELRVVQYNACRRLARRGFSVHMRRIGAVLVQYEISVCFFIGSNPAVGHIFYKISTKIKFFSRNFSCFLFSLEECGDERMTIGDERFFYCHCVNKMPGHLHGHLPGHFGDNMV